MKDCSPDVVFVCHGESSTGVCQPLDGMGNICRQANSLLLVDTVASLGAAPFAADFFGVGFVAVFQFFRFIAAVSYWRRLGLSRKQVLIKRSYFNLWSVALKQMKYEISERHHSITTLGFLFFFFCCVYFTDEIFIA